MVESRGKKNETDAPFHGPYREIVLASCVIHRWFYCVAFVIRPPSASFRDVALFYVGEHRDAYTMSDTALGCTN